MFEALVPTVLLANGMAAGVLMGTQLGGWPLLESLPPDRYVSAHAFFSTRYDPFMPVAFVVTAIGDAGLAWLISDLAPRGLFAIAAALTVSAVVVSLRRNVPVNEWIQSLDPQALPSDFAERDPRPDWGRWNRIRTVLAVLALVANCVAAGLLL